MWTIRKAVPPGRFRTVLRAFASVVALVLLLAAQASAAGRADRHHHRQVEPDVGAIDVAP
jgi:hypothetical protein